MVMCLCSTILPYIMHVFDFLNTKCIVGVDINMENYLFGFHGYDCVSLAFEIQSLLAPGCMVQVFRGW